MTRHRRRPTRHRPVPASPAALSGATTPDEAAAILADVEGRHALRRIQVAAARNLRDLPPFVADKLQRNQLDPPMHDPAPHLGIFWAVTDPHGQAHLLIHPCALAAGEKYGDCLSAPDGHYETWEAWRRGRPKPPLALLAPIIRQDQYEQWPRGRIVYEVTLDRFVVYADRQLLVPAWLAQIRARFHLPPDRTIAWSDPHYSRTRAIGPP